MNAKRMCLLATNRGFGLLGTVVEKLGVCGSKVFEKEVLVLGVLLNPRKELVVFNESNVCGQHHVLTGFLVRVLQRAIPLALDPGLIQQKLKVFVVELKGIGGPGSIESYRRVQQSCTTSRTTSSRTTSRTKTSCTTTCLLLL